MPLGCHQFLLSPHCKYGLEKKIPWLLMVQLNLASDGTPVIFSHDYHRGDRFTFDVLRRVE